MSFFTYFKRLAGLTYGILLLGFIVYQLYTFWREDTLRESKVLVVLIRDHVIYFIL